MAGMFGADNTNTKAMMQDLEDVASMYSQAKPASDDGIMKAPQGDQIDAGSWWAWLSGATRQKAQENIARVQEELSKMNIDLSGTSPQYQQELLDGILQARQYRDKWDITESLSDRPKWLEEQGDFPTPEQSEVTTEELPPMDEEAFLNLGLGEGLRRRDSNFTGGEYRTASLDFVDPETGQKVKTTADLVAEDVASKQSGLMTKPLPPSESRGGVFKAAEQDAMNIAIDNIGIDEDMWAAYKKEVSKIESGGLKNPYQVAGGANKHYDGKYQLGRMAKADAGQLLGIKLGHGKKDRALFRKNPALQEKAFAAYTAKNHSYLMNKSAKYRELDKAQQIAVLGYAHNQGWGQAKKWLDGGKEGKDAFGTKGSKYYKAIAKNLGITPSLAFTEGREYSPRPVLRPKDLMEK